MKRLLLALCSSILAFWGCNKVAENPLTATEQKIEKPGFDNFTSSELEELGVKWEDGEYLFGGDIILDPYEEQDVLFVNKLASHLGIRKQEDAGLGKTKAFIAHKKWPVYIPYVLQGGFSYEQKLEIREAMDSIENVCDVLFTPGARGNDYTYHISKVATGNFAGQSTLGYRKNPWCKLKYFNVGIAIHEFLHNLSFKHEHQKYNRDDYVEIRWWNIQDGEDHNFKKVPFRSGEYDNYGYDYNSIMHYDQYAFTKNGEFTIKPKKSANPGQRDSLSSDDKRALRYHYQLPYVNYFCVRTSGGTSFNSHQYWNRGVGTRKYQPRHLVGDFNGDGVDDIVKVFNHGGEMSADVFRSNGSSFQAPVVYCRSQGGYWATQKWLSGDFDGDGFCDIAKSFNDNNLASIDVHLSNGGSFRMQRWVTRQGGYWDSQKWLTGDFNGDGVDDLAKVFNNNNLASIDVHLSNGGSFSMQRWATRQGGYWDSQKWLTGDFNGDGVDDLARVFNDGNLASIAVNLSTRIGFGPTMTWKKRDGGFWDSQKWLCGDFDNDGDDDLARVFYDGGSTTIAVNLSNRTGFEQTQIWEVKDGGFWDGQTYLCGKFNRDRRDDLAFTWFAK